MRAAPLDALICFSNPLEPWQDGVFYALTDGWTREIASRIEPSGTKGGQETLQFIRDALSTVPDGAAVDPACSALGAALAAPRRLPYALAGAAAALSASGPVGRWRITVPRPLRFRFAQWLLPPARTLSAETGRQAVRLRAGSRSVEFNRSGATWITRDIEGLTDLASARHGIGGYAVYDTNPSGSWDLLVIERRFRRQFLPCSKGSAGRGLALIRRHAPAFHEWIARVSRVIALQTSLRGLLESGSFGHRTGMLRISSDPRPSAVAEMLAHEASHQYFYLAERLGALIDSQRATMLYSPLKRRLRPAAKLLLGYHAFANVLLLFDILRQAGYEDSYMRQSTPRTWEETSAMGEELERHASLSPLGAALFEPLRRRLA